MEDHQGGFLSELNGLFHMEPPNASYQTAPHAESLEERANTFLMSVFKSNSEHIFIQ